MSKNVVINEKDNTVELTFNGIDLTAAVKVGVFVAGISFNSVDNPTNAVILNATTLSLSFVGLPEEFAGITGQHYPDIFYFTNASSVNGTLIAGKAKGNIGVIETDGLSSLTVEDGEDGWQFTKPDTLAETYEYVNYCTKKGLPYANTTSGQELELLKAIDYISSIEGDLQGSRSYKDQPLPFPRRGMYINGFLVAANAITDDMKEIQFELASFTNSGQLFNQSGPGKQIVQKKKVGSLEISYFDGGGSGSTKPRRALSRLTAFFNDTNELMRS